jgi:hypothetical protein
LVFWWEDVAGQEVEELVRVVGRRGVASGETRLADALVLSAGEVQVTL